MVLFLTHHSSTTTFLPSCICLPTFASIVAAIAPYCLCMYFCCNRSLPLFIPSLQSLITVFVCIIATIVNSHHRFYKYCCCNLRSYPPLQTSSLQSLLTCNIQYSHSLLLHVIKSIQHWPHSLFPPFYVSFFL